MNRYTVELDLYDITNYVIMDEIVIEEELDVINSNIQLTNLNIPVFDPRGAINPLRAASMLYNRTYRGMPVTIRNAMNQVIYVGKVLNIEIDVPVNNIQIITENSLKGLFETKIQYVTDIIDNKTPVDIMKDILIIYGFKSLIHNPSFIACSDYLKLQGYIIAATYSASSGVTAGNALEELAKAGAIDLYFTNGLLKANYYTIPNTTLIEAFDIKDSDIINIKSNKDNNYLVNNYNIDIKGDSDVVNQTYEDILFNNIATVSRALYGKKDLDNVNLNIDNSNIYMNVASTGTIAVITAIENKIRRYMNPLTILEVEIVKSHFYEMELGMFFRLNTNKININNKLFRIIKLNKYLIEDKINIIAIEETGT